MRTLPSDLSAKFKNLVQANSTKSAPALDLWISRPVVPLINEDLLEQQSLGVADDVTAVDIAVCHPIHRRQSTKTYIAAVVNGEARVISSQFRHAIELHTWVDSGFSEVAEDVAIAFDATVKTDTRNRFEFVTDEQPWVFWVNDGALYGRKLGGSDTITLAETNCTKCTAIRAAGSTNGGFDYGLCLFFLLDGNIYVRQLIDGEWMDAEPVDFVPDVVWQDIAASRSWDYRVILQAVATDGTVYELFTQYMGVGQRNVEHIEIKNVRADGSLTELEQTDTKTTEHIEIAGIDAGALYGGLYSMDLPSFRSARNVPVDALDEEGTAYEDWGKVVLVELAVHLEPVSVANNITRFVLTDSKGKSFVAVSAEPINANGLTLKLTFADFNMASGTCTIAYTPGTVNTMYGLAAEAMSVQFTPENLVATEADSPEPVEAFVGAEDGTVINIRFSEPVVSGVTESTDGFSVTLPVLTGVDGIYGETERIMIPASVSGYRSNDIVVQLESGNFQDAMFNDGRLTLAKEGEST